MDNSLVIQNVPILGRELTPLTGCLHYHTDLDVIAIKFACCEEYYACYFCHQELANHPPQKWCDLTAEAILCGRCGSRFSIEKYLNCQNICPNCACAYNSRCKNHWNLYFDLG